MGKVGGSEGEDEKENIRREVSRPHTLRYFNPCALSTGVRSLGETQALMVLEASIGAEERRIDYAPLVGPYCGKQPSLLSLRCPYPKAPLSCS